MKLILETNKKQLETFTDHLFLGEDFLIPFISSFYFLNKLERMDFSMETETLWLIGNKK